MRSLNPIRVVVCRQLFALWIALTSSGAALAQNGTWTNPGGGDYHTASNWAGNQIATGAGNTADFNTIDIASDVTVPLDAPLTIGNMIFGDTNLGSGGSWALTTTSIGTALLTLDNGGSSPTITVNQLTPAMFDDAFIGNSIAGTAGLTKAGPGILTLGPGTANTLTGGINVNAGTLRLQSTMPTQPITLANGTTLVTASATNGVSIAAGGTATYTMTGASNTASNVTSTGGTLNLNIATNNTTLSAGGAWTGLTNLNVTGQNPAGVSFFRVMPNPTGGPPAFDTSVFANTRLHLDNAQLVIRTNSFGNTMPIGELSGTPSGVLSGGNAGSAARYELGGLNNSYTYNGQINGGGGISINKVGTGTITLAGPIVGGANGSTAINSPAPTQGGVFRVTQGTLAITGVSSLPGGPAANPTILTTIDVLPGAIFDVSAAPSTFTTATQQKLQGGGTIRGSHNHAAGFIQPGDVGAATAANQGNLSAGVVPTAGTITFDGNLELSGGAIIYDMSTDPASGNDLVQVTGTTTLTSGRIIQSFLNGVPAAGLTYTVLNSTGGFSGSASNLSVDLPGRGADATPFTSGNNLQFTTPAGGVVTADLVWVGNVSGAWDVEATQNWTNQGNPDRFFNFDDVTFNESAANKTVEVAGIVTPSSIEIDNTSDYSFAGGGAITGATGLTKTGSGALTMTLNNTFTGPASVTGSTVNIAGNSTGLGTGPLTLSNATLTSTASVGNSALDIPAGTTSTIQIDGAADTGGTANIPSLTGGGTLNLTSTVGNKFFGTFDTSEFTGTLNVAPSGAATQLGQIRIRAGQTDFSNAVVNLSNVGVSNQQGGGAGTTVTVGFGELHGNATTTLVAFNGGSATQPNIEWEIGALGTDSDFAGVIADGGGAISSVTKVGDGTLTLTGINTYTGNTTVEDGTLSINNPFLPDMADVFVASGAEFNLDFSGDDVIDSLYLAGMPVMEGLWGSNASGAPNTSPLLTGLGRLSVTTMGPVLGITGDYNNDGTVDAADYVIWRKNVGAAGLTNRDPNNNGPVGPDDYNSWRTNFGSASSPGAVATAQGAVPEPSAVLLAMLAVAIGSAWRRATGEDRVPGASSDVHGFR